MTESTPQPGALERLGFTDRERALFATLAEEGLEPARIARVDRGMPLAATERGLERVEPAIHLVKNADSADNRVVVGDWVALARPEGHEMPIIEAILPRKSAFGRRDPGEETGEQVLIANIDTVFVVQSLSGNGLNVRRLERELVVAWESGAQPVVVLTKADLVDDIDAPRQHAEEVAFGVDVLVESAVTGVGIDEIRKRIPAGTTAALLGGSGVGKSTMINRLVGDDIQATRAVRAGDDKGRHTTVAREIVTMPGGGVIIDTPGMRGLGLWDAEDGMEAAFPDIQALSEHCRFRDCAHENEPGCAVLAAVEEGELPARRLESYHRLTAEMDELARRRDQKAWAEKEKSNKAIAKAVKSFYKSAPKRKGR